ncbi:MAG: hypothetical protein ABSD67_11505 [Terracidiphilus sp.]|jgi:uncharacterized membrane protein YeaQ/YmgE (transglycosylase-associated protein family)
MKISPSTFVIQPRVIEEAKKILAGGEPLILEVGGTHDEKAINEYLSSPNFQKDVLVGAGAGTVTGMLVGAVVSEITRANPLVGIASTLLMGVVGAAIGGAAANEAAAVARPTPAVKVTYDPKARHLVAQLLQQPAK